MLILGILVELKNVNLGHSQNLTYHWLQSISTKYTEHVPLLCSYLDMWVSFNQKDIWSTMRAKTFMEPHESQNIYGAP